MASEPWTENWTRMGPMSCQRCCTDARTSEYPCCYSPGHAPSSDPALGLREASFQTGHCPRGGFCLVSNSQSLMTRVAFISLWFVTLVASLCGDCRILHGADNVLCNTGLSRQRVPRAPPWLCSKFQLLLPQGDRPLSVHATELRSPSPKNWSPLKASSPAFLGHKLALGLNSPIATNRYRHLRFHPQQRGLWPPPMRC